MQYYESTSKYLSVHDSPKWNVILLKTKNALLKMEKIVNPEINFVENL